MTMPKKGSRLVDVNGVSYRFMVREEGRQVFDQNDLNPVRENLKVLVEAVDSPGHILTAIFNRFKNPGLDPVGPKGVIRLVQIALKQGWAPKVMANFVLAESAIATLRR
jgi:hypothetical protein